MMTLLLIRRSILLSIALGLIVLLCAYLTYRPGLASGFFFDDAANLPVLGASGKVDRTSILLRYVTSGRADPTGRPVALLSFLVDANDWPAAPAPFKRTSLLIHMACGMLLWQLLRRLGLAHGMTASRASYAGLFAASAWLLHPLFVSTVLYAVQREAMLPVLFVLCGLHAWLSARQRMLDGRPLAPMLFAAVAMCTVLAFLSKPNGILLPVLALVLDATLPRMDLQGAGRRYRRWRNTLLLPMAVLIVAGLTWVLIRSIGHGPANGRSFTLVQRVITEPTILLDYLKLLFLLDPSYGSLFHDQYQPATGLLAPWYTLPALLACVGACATAWIYRRYLPVAAAAVLFFFAGHLIESTSLALELYFEHRNYLPSLLLFWPLGVLLTGPRWRGACFVLAISLLACLAAMTHATSALWSKPLEQAQFWALEAPESARAQAYVAQVEAGLGRLDYATDRIEKAAMRFPREPQIALTLIDLRCQQGVVSENDWAKAKRALSEAARDPGMLLSQWMERSIETLSGRHCRGFDAEHLTQLLDVSVTNPQVARLPGRMQDISHIRGLLALKSDDAAQALIWFDDALRREPGPAVALEQAARLGATGHPREGLAHLDFYDTLEVPQVRPNEGMRWLHALLLDKQGYWPHELTVLRATLTRDSLKDTP